MPEDAELALLLPCVGAEHVHLEEGTAVSLDQGTRIDLGAIAKGYASDWMAAIYQEHGITHGIVDLGGNTWVCGGNLEGEPWQIGIQDPARSAGALAGILEASDAFAVTSGGYQRYFTGPDGTVYQHILNPKTGWPVQGDLLSVTIVADNGTMADAYSTALYVMGREAAQDFWRQNGGFDMVLITKDGQVLYTPGLADKLTETEGSGYAYACIEP